MEMRKAVKSLLVGAAFIASVTACNAPSGPSQNIKIDGVDGPNVEYVNNSFLMTATLKNVSITAGARVPFDPKHMPNSYIEVGPDLNSNGMLISVGIDLNDLANITQHYINLIPPQTLPGGRPLPGVAQGQLPAIAVEVPKWDNMVFYAGPQIFGVFIPLKMNTEGTIISARFFDKSNHEIGTLSVVGEDQTKANSGFLILIPIKGAVGQLVKNASTQLN